MPRRQFIADLQTAQATSPPGILALEQGEDDGSFTFTYTVNDEPVSVTALVPDLGDYPSSHEFMIYCASDDAPQAVAAALQDIRGTDRKTVLALLEIVAARLSRLHPDRDGDVDMPDSQLDDEYEEYGGDDDVYGSDDDFQIGAPAPRMPAVPVANQPFAATTASTRAFRTRIRMDLRAAKAAGFKVGHLGHLLEGANCYVTLSVRITKLGISEEAMQAWQLEANDYLTLMIQYPNAYKTNEELQGFDSLRLRANLAMRVVAGKKYKPTLQEAIKAFTKAKKDDRLGVSQLPPPEAVEESSIRETFISKPLAALLEERLVPILRYRSFGMDWHGAERWDLQLTNAASGLNVNVDAPSAEFFEPEAAENMLPAISVRDHYRDANVWNLSFPLLAMQFTLRHFVRCTEFCLVCHRKLEGELEAIKPYVCDSPLCLFQYMAMGFGPSIEHEIIAQPYVVDLLVSFCYNSAATQKLKEFPIGLALSVPPPKPLLQNTLPPGIQQVDTTKASDFDSHLHRVGFDRDRLEIIFHQPPAKCPVRRGDWILINCPDTLTGTDTELHCRISESAYFPTIRIDPPVKSDSSSLSIAIDGALKKAQEQSDTPKPATPAATPKWVPATFYVYNQDFETLSDVHKCSAITRLLDTLPSVKEMQAYLMLRHAADLKGWVERISPAALSVLRWIIASNRACIMQNEMLTAGVSNGKQERLYGMKDFMQFRFAMGAPDKEQRFITSVRETTERLKLQYPTMFAWHGSPLHNWHSIIREGLHFKQISHGRAYGDGVYHAIDAQTSTGYSGRGYGTGMHTPGTWSRSMLRISSAIALNEIVNAPAEFQCQSPYYVVKQLDWIQTRFLFVQVDPIDESIKIGEDVKPSMEYKQDPSRVPRGLSGSISIPASAIKSSKTANVPAKQEKRKSTSIGERFSGIAKKLRDNGSKARPITFEDDANDDYDDGMSVSTDQEDIDILDDEPEPVLQPVPLTTNDKNKGNKTSKVGPETNFKPGTLDFDKLPLMPTPEYANTGTTKRLMSELMSLSKMQDSNAPAELGWYIDTEKIENVYQWIVELHSFHTLTNAHGKPLALASEMERAGLQSIVLEIRFGAEFPFTPPYIRVIKPRFLSLAQGGGGHIVMGGAMCMELLTNSGWSSVTSMESVLLQVRMAIASEPPARLDMNSTRRGAAMEYGPGEAAEGYLRACQAHGWKVPPGFKEMAYGGPSVPR